MVPPHINRFNQANWSIRTYKYYFIAGLASTDTRFPRHLWCRLIPQATMNLNILRPWQKKPTISAYTAIGGPFYFNKTPLAQPGTKVVVHKKPQQRKNWGIHGIQGWYIVPEMEHYRCYTWYAPSTRGEIDSDVVEFLPQHLIMTGLSTTEQSTKGSKELIHILKKPGPKTPFTIRESQFHAIDRLSTLFQNAQLQQPNATLVPIEVPTVAPLRVSIAAP